MFSLSPDEKGGGGRGGLPAGAVLAHRVSRRPQSHRPLDCQGQPLRPRRRRRREPVRQRLGGPQSVEVSPTFGVGLGNIASYTSSSPRSATPSSAAAQVSSLSCNCWPRAGLVGLMGFLWFSGHLMRLGARAPSEVRRLTPNSPTLFSGPAAGPSRAGRWYAELRG